MTYSSSPYVSTYATEHVDMMHDLSLFPGAEQAVWAGDFKSNMIAGTINVLPFKDENGKIYGETRNGLNAATITNGNSTLARGFHMWERSVNPTTGVSEVYQLLVTYDGTASRLWAATGIGGAWSQLLVLTQHVNGVCRFTEYIDATNNKSVVMSDGYDLYIITAPGGLIGASRVTDLDLPSPHIPFPVAIDGYVFLAKAGTGDIYNSDLNNPASWTPGNFISAEMFPDDIVALVKVNNYLLAVGQNSGEFFYDAGIASGSPLARYTGAVLPFGCPCPNSIASTKDTIMMLSEGEGGEYTFKVIKGFKHEDFPATTVLGVYQRGQFDASFTSQNVRAGFIRQNGELFYFFSPTGGGSGSTDNTWAGPTFMASLECKMWIHTRSDLTNTGTPSGAYAFPVLFSCPGISTFDYTFVAGQFSLNGGAFVGHLNPNNQSDTLDDFAFYNIYQMFMIPKQMFGTWNRKFMSRLAVDYEVIPANDVAAQALGIKVEWSDDRTQSWNTGYLAGQTNFPFVFCLGYFRERMFRISALSNRQRWRPLEVNINKGMA